MLNPQQLSRDISEILAKNEGLSCRFYLPKIGNLREDAGIIINPLLFITYMCNLIHRLIHLLPEVFQFLPLDNLPQLDKTLLSKLLHSLFTDQIPTLFHDNNKGTDGYVNVNYQM